MTVLTVKNLNSSGEDSLYAAVSTANVNGGEYIIVFDAALKGQTITIDDTLQINNSNLSLTIQGDIDGDGQADIVLDAKGQRQILNVVWAEVAIDGMVFQNGSSNAGGAIQNTSAALTVTNSDFSGNYAYVHGGAIFVSGGGATLTVDSCTFDNNATNTVDPSSSGGAINLSNGHATIKDTTFSNNKSLYGGGFYTYDGTVDITKSTFQSNSSQNNGGALNSTFGTVTIRDSVFRDNHSDTHGGAIDNAFGELTVGKTEFRDNHAVIGGGAIDNVLGGDLVLEEGNLMEGNTADTFGGGGVRIFTGEHEKKPEGKESSVQGTLVNGGDVWIGEKIAIEDHLNLIFDTTKPQIGNSYLYHNLNGFYFEGNPTPNYQVMIAANQTPWVFNLANGASALKTDTDFKVAVFDEKGKPLLDQAGEQVYLTLKNSYTVRDAEGNALNRYELLMNGNGILMLSITDARPQNLPVKWYFVNSPDSLFLEAIETNRTGAKNYPDAVTIAPKSDDNSSFHLMIVMEAEDVNGNMNRGIAWNTTIGAGGEQRVFNNGTANDTIIAGAGAIQYVFVRGTANRTVVQDGGTQYVAIAASVNDTELRGGTVILEETATLNSVILAGGTLKTKNMMDEGAIASTITQLTFDPTNTLTTRFENVAGVELKVTSQNLALADNVAVKDGDASYRSVAILINDRGDFVLANYGIINFTGALETVADSAGQIKIENTGSFRIRSTSNATADGLSTSIVNAGSNGIEIANRGTFQVDSIRNAGAGDIAIRNFSQMTLNGRLVDAEDAQFKAAIHNRGLDASHVGVENDATLTLNGALFIEAGSTGHIDIVNRGTMTIRSLDGTGNLYTSIFNKGSGDVAIANYGDFTADSVRNESDGTIAIQNTKNFTLNGRTVNGELLALWSNGSGVGPTYNIRIDNLAAMTFGGAVRSEASSTGNIEIVNTGTMSILDRITGERQIEHNTAQAAISNYGNGYLSIRNGGSSGQAAFVSGAINSFGQGQLFLANAIDCHAYLGSTGLEHLGANGWTPDDAGFTAQEWGSITPMLVKYLAGQSYSIGVIGQNGHHVPGFEDSVFLFNNGRMTLDAMVFSISDRDLVIQNGAGTGTTAGVVAIGGGRPGEVAVINLFSGDVILGGLDLRYANGSGMSFGQYRINGDIINAAAGDIVMGGITFAPENGDITSAIYNQFLIQGNIYNESTGHIFIGLADGSVIGAANAGYEIRNLVSQQVNSIVIDMKGADANGVKIYSDIIGERIFITGDGTLHGRISGGEVDPTDANAVSIVSIDGQATAPIQVNNTISGIRETDIAGSTTVAFSNAIVNATVIAGGDGVNIGGSATLTIRNSTLGGNLYGGGNGGSVAGAVTLQLTDATVNKFLFGGSVNGNVGGVTTLSLAGGSFNNVVGGSAANGAGQKADSQAIAIVLGAITAQKSNSSVFGGGYASGGGATTAQSITVTANDAAAKLYYLYGGGWATGSGSSATAGQVTMTIGAGTAESYLYGAGRAEKGAVSTVAAVQMNITGGLFRSNLVGGGYAADGSTATVSGDVTIQISGGTFNASIFGGGQIQQGGAKNGVAKVAGNISITLDCSAGNKIDLANSASVVLAGAGTKLAGGGTVSSTSELKLTLKGDAANLSNGSYSGMFNGGGGDNGGEAADRILVFDHFSGNLNAKLNSFTAIHLLGDSTVNMTTNFALANGTDYTFDLQGRGAELDGSALYTMVGSLGINADSHFTVTLSWDDLFARYELSDATSGSFELLNGRFANNWSESKFAQGCFELNYIDFDANEYTDWSGVGAGNAIRVFENAIGGDIDIWLSYAGNALSLNWNWVDFSARNMAMYDSEEQLLGSGGNSWKNGTLA